MTTIVVGATGATGRHVVRELLANGTRVRAFARAIERIPADIREHANLEVVVGEYAGYSASDFEPHMVDCDAIVCCLGHTLSFRGIYGHPRLLVTSVLRSLCEAALNKNTGGVKRVVLMNSTGCRDDDIDPPEPRSQRLMVGLIRNLVPPHRDNELAAAYLRDEIGRDRDDLQFVIVRPDGLVDQSEVTEYQLVEAPTRNVIFDAGQSSRINVANFMARLVHDEQLWDIWCGKSPVLYNVDQA